jgi:hypothetical protein
MIEDEAIAKGEIPNNNALSKVISATILGVFACKNILKITFLVVLTLKLK